MSPAGQNYAVLPQSRDESSHHCPLGSPMPRSISDGSTNSWPAIRRFGSREECAGRNRLAARCYTTALHPHDKKPAEILRVEEGGREPKSPRAAKLFTFVGGIFFLDGQYLNS